MCTWSRRSVSADVLVEEVVGRRGRGGMGCERLVGVVWEEVVWDVRR